MTHSEQQLGSVIRRDRIERGLTQNKLSEKTDITSRQIMFIENGQCYPQFETLCRIVQALNIPPDHIFNPETMDDHMALDSLIALFRSCPPDDQGLVLATMQTLVEQLKSRRKSTPST